MQVPLEAHQPQPMYASWQSAQFVCAKQLAAGHEKKSPSMTQPPEHAPAPGPSPSPALQVPLAPHQPQPSTAPQASQSDIAAQSGEAPPEELSAWVLASEVIELVSLEAEGSSVAAEGASVAVEGSSVGSEGSALEVDGLAVVEPPSAEPPEVDPGVVDSEAPDSEVVGQPRARNRNGRTPRLVIARGRSTWGAAV
jgi:hypothetical protein